MNNKVAIVGRTLEVEPQGLDKMWSFTGKLVVPLEHVLGASEDPGILDDAKGLRAPGLHVPGKWAGTYIEHGEKTFWNVTRPEVPLSSNSRVSAMTDWCSGWNNPASWSTRLTRPSQSSKQ